MRGESEMKPVTAVEPIEEDKAAWEAVGFQTVAFVVQLDHDFHVGRPAFLELRLRLPSQGGAAPISPGQADWLVDAMIKGKRIRVAFAREG